VGTRSAAVEFLYVDRWTDRHDKNSRLIVVALLKSRPKPKECAYGPD